MIASGLLFAFYYIPYLQLLTPSFIAKVDAGLSSSGLEYSDDGLKYTFSLLHDQSLLQWHGGLGLEVQASVIRFFSLFRGNCTLIAVFCLNSLVALELLKQRFISSWLILLLMIPFISLQLCTLNKEIVTMLSLACLYDLDRLSFIRNLSKVSLSRDWLCSLLSFFLVSYSFVCSFLSRPVLLVLVTLLRLVFGLLTARTLRKNFMVAAASISILFLPATVYVFNNPASDAVYNSLLNSTVNVEFFDRLLFIFYALPAPFPLGFLTGFSLYLNSDTFLGIFYSITLTCLSILGFIRIHRILRILLASIRVNNRSLYFASRPNISPGSFSAISTPFIIAVSLAHEVTRQLIVLSIPLSLLLWKPDPIVLRKRPLQGVFPEVIPAQDLSR